MEIKNFEMEFLVDGIKVGSGSFHFDNDGKIQIEDVEEEFYKTLRKNETNWKEETKEYIIDNLTDKQEKKLREAHAEDYHGTDDDMSDDFDNGFLTDISYEKLAKIINHE